MRFIEMNKRLVGFAAALGSLALVTGCSSTKSSEPEPSMYYSSYSVQSSTPSSSTWYATGGAPTGSASSTQAQGAAASTDASRPGEISIPLYEEQLTVGTRRVESGSVRLRKQVTTETVNQPVQIRRETLVIDREAGASVGEAAKDGSGTFTPFEQKEIVIKLHTEEPVIEKRVVATGRIVAKTSTNAEQVTVSREVRKENIDVEKIGNTQNVTISGNVSARPSDAVGGTGTGSQQTQGGAAQGQPQGTKPQGDQSPDKDRTPPAEEK